MSIRVAEFVLAAAGLIWVETASVATPAVPAPQSEADRTSREGILLLRNGNLLRGQVTRTGDRYQVAVHGGQIQVHCRDVEFVCPTLEEAYLYKKARVRPGNVRDHLQLAQWCGRHDLLGFAAEQLAEAKALNPQHPLVPVVERSIRTPIRQPDPTRKAGEPTAPGPSVEELDRLVRGMPPGSVEAFTETIQPLLLNSCSSAGCHGPNTKSQFRLVRMRAGSPPSRRLTQRNLHSALGWIDRDEPAASPILTAPIQPHGSAKAAIFTDQHLGQYRRLMEWVYQVAQQPAPAAPGAREPQDGRPAEDQPPGLVIPAVHSALVNPEDDASPSSNGGTFPASAPAVQSPSAPEQEAADRRPRISPSPVKRGASVGRFVPVDPFDPQIFNRRFFPTGDIPKDEAAGSAHPPRRS